MVKKSSALLMQDDAHGFGVFEPIIPQNSIYMATLGKAHHLALKAHWIFSPFFQYLNISLIAIHAKYGVRYNQPLP
jgi:hypothetical protein